MSTLVAPAFGIGTLALVRWGGNLGAGGAPALVGGRRLRHDAGLPRVEPVECKCWDAAFEWPGLVMLYEIVAAVAHPDHTVTITWSDGVLGVVDFLPIIDRGGWFTPLRDPDYFIANMVLLSEGRGLT